MELPYTGRARLTENFGETVINIPSKKNWFAIIFLSFWLCGWLAGESFAIAGIFGRLGGSLVGGFIFIWLAAWSIGGFFAIRTLVWMVFGVEVITVGPGSISIDKMGLIFYRAKTYDLNEAKKFRVSDTDNSLVFAGRQFNNASALGIGGVIRFDYGFKTIRFANGIDEAEASYILERLKAQGLLGAANF